MFMLGDIKTIEIFKSPAFLMNTYTFWSIIPYSKVGVKWRLGGAYGLHYQGQWVSQARNEPETSSKQSPQTVSFLNYFSYLKMEMLFFSKMTVNFHWIAWHYESGDTTLLSQHCDNPKSSTAILTFVILFKHSMKECFSVQNIRVVLSSNCKHSSYLPFLSIILYS
jgi:hypothetical protein